MWKKQIKHLEFSDQIRQVRISPVVVKIFKRYEQKEGKFESGGILLGYVYEDHDNIVKVTKPSQFDSKSLTFFNRSKIPAQLQINRSWKKSKGSLIYLGEWHTHSEIEPTPSKVDIEMIKKTFKETTMEIYFLYLIIVGMSNTYWVGKQTSNCLTKFDRIG